MQLASGLVELVQAALAVGAGIRELLRHVRKRPGQAAQLVFALQCQFGPQVARRHLAHAVSQQQQGTRQLIAQQDGQQDGTQHGQEQAQCEGADVHAPQAITGQGPLLVFAVGGLHLQRVVDQRGGQLLGHHQQTPVFAQGQAPLRKQHQDLDSALVTTGDGFVQPLHPGQTAVLPSLPQLLGRGAVGPELKARRASAGHHLPPQAPDGHIAGTQLGADFFSREGRVELAGFCPVGGGGTALLVQVFAERVQGGPPQVQACHQGRLHFHVKPAFDRARDELVRHHINEQTGDDTHQGKNASELDQQA